MIIIIMVLIITISKKLNYSVPNVNDFTKMEKKNNQNEMII